MRTSRTIQRLLEKSFRGVLKKKLYNWWSFMGKSIDRWRVVKVSPCTEQTSNIKVGRSKGVWVRVRQACFLAKITFFEDEFIVFSCHLRFHMYVIVKSKAFYILNINTREINGKANEKTIKIYDRLGAIKQKLFVTDQTDFRGCRCVFAGNLGKRCCCPFADLHGSFIRPRTDMNWVLFCSAVACLAFQ